MEITRDHVLKLAELVRIEMSEEDADKYRKDLSNIIKYFEDLNEIDTSSEAVKSEMGDHIIFPQYPLRERSICRSIDWLAVDPQSAAISEHQPHFVPTTWFQFGLNHPRRR